MISSSASTTTNSIANVMVDPGVSQTSGTSTVTAKGANTPQMFWITLNNYQMLVMFLLLKIRCHDSLRELLESMKLSTFTLNIVSLPGIEQIKDAIVKDSKSSKSGHIGSNLDSVGFKNGIFLADYTYLFTALIILSLLHLIFTLSIRVPKNPKNKCENFFVTLNRFFHYT